MKWHVEWPPERARDLERIAERTGVIPQALRDKPEVEPHLMFFWRAFQDLHSTRSGGFGPNPIQFSDILAWCTLHSVDDQATQLEVLDMVMDLDAVYLTAYSKKQEREREQSKPRPSTGPSPNEPRRQP